jgi:deoxyribodipyrimidine photo-lyase
MEHGPAIVWFRNDLRLLDNPAFTAAVAKGYSILPLFIWAPDEENGWPPGGASKWWLHHSLKALSKMLGELGLPLIIRVGKSLDVLEGLVKDVRAQAVFWNRRYEPWAIKRDAQIKTQLTNDGCLVQSFNGSLLVEPWNILNSQGKPFQVFTAFWKSLQKQYVHTPPLPIPSSFSPIKASIRSVSLDHLHLLPEVNWYGQIEALWTPGEVQAGNLLDDFIENHVTSYQVQRDFPGINGVSHLSPYLHFGEISAKTIWHKVKEVHSQHEEEVGPYIRQLGWREFANYLLYHFPQTVDKPLRTEFSRFPWWENQEALKAWHKGKTGFPIVDAGMRELWSTGWMHNRVRMIVGSFLVKDLLVSWQYGARWFWDTLLDADMANNTLGWQWISGCGADAAPYFRIFNPVTQGQKFDADGVYVRRWIPELASLPNEYLHCPWEAPEQVLRSSGVQLGTTYPNPIVDHSEARNRALLAFREVRSDREQ